MASPWFATLEYFVTFPNLIQQNYMHMFRVSSPWFRKMRDGRNTALVYSARVIRTATLPRLTVKTALSRCLQHDNIAITRTG
jgi:hypothetical protein